MSIRDQFTTSLKEALKSKDTVTSSTIRLIMAALKDRDIAARSDGKTEGIAESDILSMLAGMVKQRQDSAKIYVDAGREDMAEREEAEIVIIQGFMPKQLGDDELAQIITDIITKTGAESVRDMGKVMGVLKGDYAGQVDMSKAGGLVKQKLG